jgi:hypothetical protein
VKGIITLKLFNDLGFTQTFRVAGRASIADLFKPSQRCGIYVLHCSNDEYYAGQALDVTRRYIQHLKNHDDICDISFMRVPQKRLDQEEIRVIHTLEEVGLKLRNIRDTSIPHGESDFDLIMPPEEQELWLNDLKFVGDKNAKRIIDEDLRRKYRRRFDSFIKKEYACQVIELLQDYVRFCIPAARREEVSFWAVSCLPQPTVYARINIYWQEVLTAFISEGSLWFSLHMARNCSPIETLPNKSWNKFMKKYPSLGFFDHQYQPGGPDQIKVEIAASELQEFIQNPEVLPAIRLFNLRLMQKGPSNWGKNHCLDLADHLLEKASTQTAD